MANSLVRIFRETWFFWVLFLCGGVAFGRYSAVGYVSWRFRFAFNLAFALLAAAWIVADAKRQQRALSFGFPALVFFLWPIFVPLYLFQTRGVRAFLILFGFAVAYCILTMAGIFIGRMTI